MVKDMVRIFQNHQSPNQSVAWRTGLQCGSPFSPGFTWSSAPGRDWTLQDTARIFDKLMRGLGYQAYVTQGGDWCHLVVRELGAKYGQSCKAMHTNMCPAVPDVLRDEWTDREVAAQVKIEWFLRVTLDMNWRCGLGPRQ